MRIHIRPRALLLYAFCLLIAFLAGMSFGGMLNFLFWVLFLYPVCAACYTITGFYLFRFHEDFSHEHPARGDTVHYRLSFSNESPFTSTVFGVRFRMVYPGMEEGIRDFVHTLKPRGSLKQEYSIRCPYRGIYTIGLESLLLRDPLGWLTLQPAVWYRTFYVYPRITQLASLPANIERSARGAGSHSGLVDDPTLFQALTDYRSGAPVKHIAWKKFMATGLPALKTYEKSALPGLTICIDLRRLKEPDPNLLEREDCSMEILVAVVHYLAARLVPVTVLGINEDHYSFAGSAPEHFSSFYKSTLNIRFAGSHAPAEFLIREQTAVQAHSLLFITHIMDPGSFELMSAASLSGLTLSTIFNQAGLTETESAYVRQMIQAARDKGGCIICVQNNGTLKGDLEKA